MEQQKKADHQEEMVVEQQGVEHQAWSPRGAEGA